MNEKYLSFLKKYNLYNKNIFDYINDRTIHIDYYKEDSICFFGCYPKMENNIVKEINLCVPNIVDDITISINIHEYVHLYKMFNYLNKEYYFTEYEELLPVMYELIFLKETNNHEYLNSYIERIKAANNYLVVLLDIFNLDNKGYQKKK